MKPRVSFSGRTLFNKCPRKYRLNTMYRKWSVKPAVELGVAFHKLMEIVTVDGPEGLFAAYDVWRDEKVEAYGRQQIDGGLTKLIEAYDKATALFYGYMDVARMGHLTPRIKLILASEHRFLLELDSVIVPGVIDFIALTEDDELVIADYKTTGIKIDTYRSYLLKSAQAPLYYHWAQSPAFDEAFPEIAAQYGRPTSFIYEIIGTPQIRLKKSETLQEYLERYRQCFSDEPERYIVRHRYTPTQVVIDDTLVSFAKTGDELGKCVNTGYWEKRDHTCLSNGKLCELAEECDSFTSNPDKDNKLVQITGIDMEDVGDDDGAQED